VSSVPPTDRAIDKQNRGQFSCPRATWYPHLWWLSMDNTLSSLKLIVNCPLGLFAQEFSVRTDSPNCQSGDGQFPNWQPQTGLMNAVEIALSPSPHELHTHSATCMWWQASQVHSKLWTPGKSRMPIWESTPMPSHTWVYNDRFCTLYSWWMFLQIN